MRFPFVGNIRRVMADKLKSHGAVGYREKDDIVDSDRLAGRSLPFSKIINEECPRLENYYRGTNRVIARFIIKNGQICATLDRAMVNYNLLQSIN